MTPTIKSVLAFGVGFAAGWAARSLGDSPQGVGVKLFEIGMKAKEKIGQWAAVERERIEDMMAEARAKVDTAQPGANGVSAPTNGVHTTNGAA